MKGNKRKRAKKRNKNKKRIRCSREVKEEIPDIGTSEKR